MLKGHLPRVIHHQDTRYEDNWSHFEGCSRLGSSQTLNPEFPWLVAGRADARLELALLSFMDKLKQGLLYVDSQASDEGSMGQVLFRVES